VISTIAIPLVITPSRAPRAALGAVIVAALVAAVFLVVHFLRRYPFVHDIRRQGKRRGWAIDLRMAVIVLVTLAFIAQKVGASLLIAGFGTGLLVGAVGGPKRLSREVLGLGQGFLVPLVLRAARRQAQPAGAVQRPPCGPAGLPPGRLCRARSRDRERRGSSLTRSRLAGKRADRCSVRRDRARASGSRPQPGSGVGYLLRRARLDRRFQLGCSDPPPWSDGGARALGGRGGPGAMSELVTRRPPLREREVGRCRR
jgi:hypothetical protein